MCKRVENPHIQECTLLIPPPEILYHDVIVGTVLPVGCPVCQLLSHHWLQAWLSANIVTHVTQEVSSDVTALL